MFLYYLKPLPTYQRISHNEIPMLDLLCNVNNNNNIVFIMSKFKLLCRHLYVHINYM